MATVYNVMLYGGLALAIVFAIVAVVLFFVLKIPKAVGIATGSTARKKIDEIKEKGYESVQGGGASKQEAIKNHTSRVSVRDVKSTAAEKHSEKGMANYEKAIADLGKKRLEDEGETATDILRDDAEEATDILREDEENLDINGSSFEEATDILICVFLVQNKICLIICITIITLVSANTKFNKFLKDIIKFAI